MSNPITPWAATPLYPAGGSAWSGTPTKVAPASTYATPNVPVRAQEFNYLLNQRDAILGSVAMGIWATAVANWNEPTSDLGGAVVQNSPTAACWDAFSGQWMVACEVTDTTVLPTVMCSPDGKLWRSITNGLPGTATSIPLGIATNPSTGDIAIFRSDGTTTSFTRFAAGTGSGTDTAQAFLAGVDQGVVSYWNGGFIFVGATSLLGVNWTGAAASSTNGAGAWTNTTPALPAGFASGTGNPILEWLTAQSATTLVIAMCGLTVATSTSRLMSQSTSSPGTWTDITPGILGGTAKQIRGLTYSANDGLWGMLAVDNSNSYLYTSPDLSTWTLVHTFTGYAAVGVSTIGSAWAVMAYNVGLAQGGTRVLYSVDVGSAVASSTWRFGAYCEDTSGQAVLPTLSPGGLLLSSGQQLLRCEILRIQTTSLAHIGGMVASSGVAGFVGSVPITPLLSTAPTVIKLTHANSPASGPQKPALYGPATVKVDVSGGDVGLDLGLAGVPDGTDIEIVNTAGAFATHNCTLTDSSGRTFEIPSSPLTFTSSLAMSVTGESLSYMLDADNARWKLV